MTLYSAPLVSGLERFHCTILCNTLMYGMVLNSTISFEDVQAFTELVKTYQMLRWHSVCIWQQELPSPLVYYTHTLSLSLCLSLPFSHHLVLSLWLFFYHPWIITYYAHSLSAFPPGCTLNLSFCLLPSPLALFPFVFFFFFHHSWYTSAFPPSLLLIYYTHTSFSLPFCMCACGWYILFSAHT